MRKQLAAALIIAMGSPAFSESSAADQALLSPESIEALVREASELPRNVAASREDIKKTMEDKVLSRKIERLLVLTTKNGNSALHERRREGLFEEPLLRLNTRADEVLNEIFGLMTDKSISGGIVAHNIRALAEYIRVPPFPMKYLAKDSDAFNDLAIPMIGKVAEERREPSVQESIFTPLLQTADRSWLLEPRHRTSAFEVIKRVYKINLSANPELAERMIQDIALVAVGGGYLAREASEFVKVESPDLAGHLK